MLEKFQEFEITNAIEVQGGVSATEYIIIL